MFENDPFNFANAFSTRQNQGDAVGIDGLLSRNLYDGCIGNKVSIKTGVLRPKQKK